MSRTRTVIATELLLLLGLLAFVGVAYLVENLLTEGTALSLSKAGMLAFAAFPAALWLGYFHLQDRHEPVPRRFVVGVWLLGAFVAGPCAEFLISHATLPRLGSPLALEALAAERIVAAIAIAGVASQLAVYAVVRYSVYPSDQLSRPVDPVIYATAAATGVATFENLRFLQELGGDFYLSLGATQVATTTLGYAALGAVLGLALGLAKFADLSAPRRGAVLGAGLAFAAILHGGFWLAITVLPWGPGFLWQPLTLASMFAALIFAAVAVVTSRLTLAGEAP